MYSKIVLDHFTNPRNVGTIDGADGYARVESSVHNDLIDLYIQVEDGKISDVKYRVRGCVAAIASTSIASELIRGLPLDAASDLTAEQISMALDGLPDSKIQCSVLAPEAVRLAIEAFRKSNRHCADDQLSSGDE